MPVVLPSQVNAVTENDHFRRDGTIGRYLSFRMEDERVFFFVMPLMVVDHPLPGPAETSAAFRLSDTFLPAIDIPPSSGRPLTGFKYRTLGRQQQVGVVRIGGRLRVPKGLVFLGQGR